MTEGNWGIPQLPCPFWQYSDTSILHWLYGSGLGLISSFLLIPVGFLHANTLFTGYFFSLMSLPPSYYCILESPPK